MATALSNCALVLTIMICVDKGVNRGRRWSMDLRQRSEREEKRRVGLGRWTISRSSDHGRQSPIPPPLR